MTVKMLFWFIMTHH